MKTFDAIALYVAFKFIEIVYGNPLITTMFVILYVVLVENSGHNTAAY